MQIKVKSDRLNFVKKQHDDMMNNMMSGPEFVPVALNGERTDLHDLQDVQKDIRDRFGLNVMGASEK